MNRLTYDGFGINDGDEYATRLCTFAKGVPEPRRKELGPLLATAPDLLAALKNLQRVIRDEYHLLDIKKRPSLCLADAQAGSAIAQAERTST